jgi:hypothetical protein
MPDRDEAARIARTEALFREVNERISETAERLEGGDAEFICECADPACTTRVPATLAEYERVRGEGDTFLLVPGHDDARVETVVRHEADGDVVRKFHPSVRPLVLALDPRAT